MARYLIDNKPNEKDDILGFNYDGYHYSSEHTQNELAPVFIR